MGTIGIAQVEKLVKNFYNAEDYHITPHSYIEQKNSSINICGMKALE